MEIRRLNRLPNNIHLLRNVELQIRGIYDWSLPCNQVSSFRNNLKYWARP